MIYPPSLTGSITAENDELKKVFDVIHVVDVTRVELVAYSWGTFFLEN